MNQLHSYILSNEQGMRVEILNYGARVKSILFPVNDTPTEMTVGYADSSRYLTDTYYLGATCGRVANRISGASFELEGEQYLLNKNDGENCLHGGADNFSLRFWQVQSSTANEVILSLSSEDGDQGFPGKVEMQIRYHLSHDNKLTMSFSATTNKATPINATNHCYFNLGEQNCLPLTLQINAASYLERDNNSLPTGRVLSVKNSDFCFDQPVIIGQRLQSAQHPQLTGPTGFDHCFVINQPQANKAAAVLSSLRNKVKMSLYTDQASIQLYTGAFLAAPLSPDQGVCLEAQNYSDAVNFPDFENSILKPGEVYNKYISYHFENI
ncbi:aldose epimerase family protein [Pseudoalteromonas sp. SCQQ13]|uniref:aldose epimerase family protein n=1 Tax=Pseudoalteromonas sp. SCQQ13 TaxID=2792066 RepID=UPI0018CF1B87|nr:aldose epimerase family protein [Pseudoalteromonas sp. SCQQ13]MBH0092957.1 galactose mutarotase [Pseudoalteromonas sp. SCQQ13]